MYKLSQEEIELILAWYRVAKRESETEEVDAVLAESLERFIQIEVDMT